jgi:serine/threonine-protein kinase
MPEPLNTTKFINDRYLIRKTLGRGGMGEVLLVEDSWNRYEPQALKKMRRDNLNTCEVNNLRREFLSASHLFHPNLAKADAFGLDWNTGDYFFTSEYVDGVHLDAGLKESAIDRILEGLVQTCRGMDFIHSHGFVHGDIKPENILLYGKSEVDELDPEAVFPVVAAFRFTGAFN